MSIEYRLLTLAVTPLLAGCSTFSFAPPPVDLTNATNVNGSSACAFNTTQASVRYDAAQGGTAAVDAAVALTNNFVLAYRCASHQAANGRQGFQVPSFIAALTGIAAPVFGAGKDVSLVAGVTAATFNSANGYWVPQEKSAILDSALDALLCIQNESVGIPFIETRDPKDRPAELGSDGEDSIPISAGQRYYSLVSTSLFQVERILAKRLRTTGVFDPAGIAAEIEKLSAEKKDAAGTPSEDSDNADPPQPADPPASEAAGTNDPRGGPTKPRGAVKAPATPPKQLQPKPEEGVFKLKIKELQPRMQLCVVRAKM